MIVLVSIIYIYSGKFNIVQSPDDSFLTRVFTKAKDRSISKRIKDIKTPPLVDTSLFHIGFAHYNEMCVTCHGGPGLSPDELSRGIFPSPPEFYKLDKLPEPAEAFWVIKNGIKFTAMPAFGPTHDDQKIWAITAFLLNKMDKMSPEEYSDWKKNMQKEMMIKRSLVYYHL